MKWRSVGVIGLCGAFSVLVPEASLAHLGHPGYSGLISTPDATVLPQGHLALSFTLLEGTETYLFAPRTNRIYAVTVGILPGLEATLRQTQVIGWYDPEAPGVAHALDRMVSAKYQFPLSGPLKLAIGIQDIASANFLAGIRGHGASSTQYGQSTLYSVLGSTSEGFTWHAGWGASHSFINGAFAGVAYRPLPWLEFMAEYDSRRFNWGTGLSPINPVRLQLTQIGSSTLSLSSSFIIAL